MTADEAAAAAALHAGAMRHAVRTTRFAHRDEAPGPAQTAFLAALSEVYPRVPLLVGFDLVAEAEAIAVLRGGPLGRYGFVEAFLRSHELDAVAPDLEAWAAPPGALTTRPSRTGTLTWNGQLAAHLGSVTCYGRFPGSAADAKRLAAPFVHELIGDRHEDCQLFRLFMPWARSWNGTSWVLVDGGPAPKVTLLALGDPD